MNIYHFYYFILILKEIFSSNNKIYRIPFGLFKQKSSEDSYIINNIINTGKYVNLSFGTPSQITKFELDTNSQTFCASNELFNRNNSLTYEQISRGETYFDYEVSEYGYTSKDILNIDDKTNRTDFILATKFQDYKLNNLGVIGLLIPKRIQYGVYPFFESLKKAKLVNSSIWTLKFNDNISLIEQINFNDKQDKVIGEFIFGDEPSKYENNSEKYNASEYFKINTLSRKDIIYWEFEFTNIYLKFKGRKNNSIIYFLGRKDAKILINFSLIVGPTYFFDFIKTNYFSQYISEKICFEKRVESDYSYIECDSTLKIENFPTISFQQVGFQYTFNFTYKDLFIEDKTNNKYIFLILKKDYFLDWILGTVFLRKFQFVFNIESKTIGYYRQFFKDDEENNDEDDNKDNNSDTTRIIIIVSLAVIFAILLIIFGMVIQKFCCKDRKKRANELKDNYEYESENAEENILAINEDKTKIKENDYKKF